MKSAWESVWCLHLSPLFLFLHCQQCSSVTLSPLQRRMLLPHFGHDPSLCNSPLSCRNFTPFFMVWKQKPREQVSPLTISSHSAVPEGSFWDDGHVFNYVLVRHNCGSRRMLRVITTKVLPHGWKVLHLKMIKKPLWLHTWRVSVMDQLRMTKTIEITSPPHLHWPQQQYTHSHCPT